MFARVRIFQTTPEGVEKGATYFAERVLPATRSIPGFEGAYFLVDRSTNTAIGITFWKDADAVEASGKLGEAMREEREDAMRPSDQMVGIFEVTAQD